ncbi:hypothetical protein GGS23DRAFT_140538 [Durotheca rogersii]|uniref:uncharacterized protein n=1 Tax=Durotheca rogersii TaxID=419775 RepID=UPI00222048A4|nr:uncharacterized protein GGS23DRAFT_140538 [Durotheca rogersii]KAI5861588.1 hypothetical protein GGS23DRAFT_140538 [Durotheca rogersii]
MMARTLPWQRIRTSPPLATMSTTPVRHQREGRSGPDPNGLVASTPAPRKQTRRLAPESSLASSSPPPEPLAESPMLAGLERDDRFRMVEDELLATARLFTAHLHAAEYARLKAAASERPIRGIARPVVGRATNAAKWKLGRRARLEREAQVEDGREARRGDARGSTSLLGLMEGPQPQGARLGGLDAAAMAPRATTRAAAGFEAPWAGDRSAAVHGQRDGLFGSSKGVRKRAWDEDEETESDGGDDELDATAPSRPTSNVLPATTASQPLAQSKPAPAVDGENKKSRGLAVDARSTTKVTGSKATEDGAGSSGDSDDDLLSRVKRRQEDRQRMREQRKRLMASKPRSEQAVDDIIPGFL